MADDSNVIRTIASRNGRVCKDDGQCTHVCEIIEHAYIHSRVSNSVSYALFDTRVDTFCMETMVLVKNME